MVDQDGLAVASESWLSPCRRVVMAFFTTNICKFRECNLTFTSLSQLIEHIEEKHIDNDPSFLEKQEVQQPTALALSYVMRFVTDAAKHQPKEKKKSKLYKSSSPKNFLIGSKDKFDRLNSDSDSDESLVAKLGSSYNANLVVQSRHKGDGSKSKPYLCPVSGCKKRYKNINGMKYHSRNGHRKDKSEKPKKSYHCDCGKSYRSSQGLRQHMIAQHPPTPLTTTATKPKQTVVKNPAATPSTVAPSLFTSGSRVGLSLANGSFLLEQCAPTNVSGAGVSVEPGTRAVPSLTQGLQKQVVTKNPSSTGFTLVTLPSASLGTVKIVGGGSQRQVQSTVTPARMEQIARSLESGQATVRTITGGVVRNIKVQREVETGKVQ